MVWSWILFWELIWLLILIVWLLELYNSSHLNKSMTFSINIHKNIHTGRLIPINTYGLQDISQGLWLWVFIYLSFSFSSFIIHLPFIFSLSSASLLPSLFLPYCLSSSLHCSHFFCFSFKLCAFLSLLHSHISSFCLLCLLPQASCVYISVVYFYKCQTVVLAFVYWSREKEMEREAERMG